jgi:dienelactone hydrolase
MNLRFGTTFCLLFAVVGQNRAGEAGWLRVLPVGQAPSDSRLGAPRTLNGYFPWTPPATLPDWVRRRAEVRNRMLVATGLWPMPDRHPVRAVIHGRIDRDDYTVEKVFFASYPGHHVSGNLYRPKGKTGKLPAVLSPHGHWPNGRMFDGQVDYGEKYVQEQLRSGAEKTREGARYPLQARCAQLARMGCVVFHYDMVGYADSKQIDHRLGFTDAEAELRLQNFMGLQTFNSICALDFLAGLPEVDPSRIAVTGASGGGTQTFMLCALDGRPAVSFPAVMVSTAMQGGCVCENCSYLRQGTGNIEFAALFAPRPLGMSGADDWTKEIETRGLPQLKQLYRLYGAESNVMAKAYVQFSHNYNQVSRELMYNWMNKHLQLGLPEPVVEKPFTPVPVKDLSVYDQEHPRPADGTDVAGLRKYLTSQSDAQIKELLPRDTASLKRYRATIGTALKVMVGDVLPQAGEIEARTLLSGTLPDGLRWSQLVLGRKGKEEQVPAVTLHGREFDGTLVIWIHPQGKASLAAEGGLTQAASALLERKAAILAPDVFMTGEFEGAKRPGVDAQFAGFTFGYNRPLLANRVHDILTTVSYARNLEGVKKVCLVGWSEAGPWVLLARALCGEAVSRTAADGHRFHFKNVLKTDDAMMLPGGLKYGGLYALAGLSAPGELVLYGTEKDPGRQWLRAAYDAAGASGKLHISTALAPQEVIGRLMP